MRIVSQFLLIVTLIILTFAAQQDICRIALSCI